MSLVTTIAIRCPVTKRHLVIDVMENQDDTYMDYLDWELGYMPDKTDIEIQELGALRNVIVNVTESKFNEIKGKYEG